MKDNLTGYKKYIILGVGIALGLVIFFKLPIMDYFTQTPYQYVVDKYNEKIVKVL